MISTLRMKKILTYSFVVPSKVEYNYSTKRIKKYLVVVNRFCAHTCLRLTCYGMEPAIGRRMSGGLESYEGLASAKRTLQIVIGPQLL